MIRLDMNFLFSKMNIGKIIACPPNDDDDPVCFETLDTARPIADALGLSIDTSWHVHPLSILYTLRLINVFDSGADENTDDNCVTDLAKAFEQTSSQAILIVWDIGAVDDLIKDSLDLNGNDAKDDGVHSDFITVVEKGLITGVISQNCSGIDGIAPGTGTVKRSVDIFSDIY
ncbi:hypothetical protein D9613_010912 [Agrocybe pediades]|uniref:Uncharacterized protein n=1 Tax=Agrocybe pediades TaxID=84607 RepID=A0A8H4QLM2_9AGAR|nr:hypothetical protein D9613_010912 [Agrocybe pediades]